MPSVAIVSRGGIVAVAWDFVEYDVSIATGVVNPAIGLGVGDSGCRLDAAPGNEGDLEECSDGRRNDGVAGEY